MASLRPFAFYGLEIPADDIAVEADGSMGFPPTVSELSLPTRLSRNILANFSIVPHYHGRHRPQRGD